ncbi:MAG TPA: DedA family protein [Hyphomicrobiaceae bacterium]|nr:DedA family protein [Hyphomicrobiaceae bacterium]
MTLAEIPGAITTLIEANRMWAAPIVLILAFGESIAFISLILPFWGMLVAIGAAVGAWSTEFVLLWIAASIGAALGDWVSYWLGYHYHEQISRMWPLSKHPDLMPRGHAFFEKYGVWAIVLGRFSGPLRASVPIIAGATQMDRTKFQIANWSSAFLWALVLLVFGGGIGEVMGMISRWLGS